MNKDNFGIALVSAFIALTFAAIFFYAGYAPRADIALGSATDNTFLEANTSVVYAGPQVDILLVATNTARQYLEISNIATTSGQTLFCNTNDRPATVNAGFPVFASTTKSFNLDNMYRGAIHCRYQTATSAVAVLER